MKKKTQEYSKPKEQKKNKYLILQLARVIGETATKLQEMGMSPPVFAKLYSMISQEILQGTIPNDPIELEKYLKMFKDTLDEDKEKAIPKLDVKENVSKNNESNPTATAESDNDGDDHEIDPLGAETAIPPPIDKKNDTRSDGESRSETSTAQGDQPIFG